MEVWNKKVHFYVGDYSKYESLKQQRLEQLEAAHKNQQDQIHHLETFINRFRYQATKASQVQSRIKELSKIERIELPQEEKTIHFKFPQPKPSGRVVVELQNVAKSYGDLEVFKGVNLNIEKGDRIALVGHNGAGKSTLIRILADLEPLTEGTRKTGHKVDIDYFAQDQYKVLDPKALLLDDLSDLVPRATQTELRSLLGSFLFQGDEVYKPIGVLSGGERNRYAIARVLVHPSNFLLLDEPTNHLDMRAKDVLLHALLEFTGTVAFVSHDRYFIDRLATKVFAVGNGEVVVYPGNYEDYLWSTRRDAERPSDKPVADISASLQAALAHASEEEERNGVEKEPAARKRMNPIQAGRLREEASGIEGKIGRLEKQIEDLQQKLNGSFKDHQQSAEIVGRMEEHREKIRAHEKKREALAEKLEAEA
jgi:ATP-binding cassette subfamily F protein 3